MPTTACCPHDVRTAKSRRFEGLVVGSDGLLCRREQKGPPDFSTYKECFAVHECAFIMAKMVSPPRISGYYKKMKRLATHYPTCWALQYQADDRWRHEQILELRRKESRRRNKRVLQGYWPGFSCEESEFHPDYPFYHLLWMAVNTEKANRWWYDNF